MLKFVHASTDRLVKRLHYNKLGTSTEYPASKNGHVDSLQAYSKIYLTR